MSNVTDWANTASGNNTGSPPDNPVEGQAPSTVNDCMRENMAAVRRHAEDGGGFDWGDTITFVSSNTFTVTGAGNLAARYQHGRKVIITGTLTGEISGVIRATSGALDVTIDSANNLENDGDLAVILGPRVELLSDLPIGTVMPMAYSLATPRPVGWLPCDGSSVAEVDWPDLFALVGTTFGGGAGSFNLPDHQGRVTVGENGAASGTLPQIGNDIGSTAGVPSVTLQANESGFPGEVIDQTFPVQGQATTPFGTTAVAADSADVTVLTQSTGIVIPADTSQLSVRVNYTQTARPATSAHENLPPAIVQRHFIKAVP